MLITSGCFEASQDSARTMLVAEPAARDPPYTSATSSDDPRAAPWNAPWLPTINEATAVPWPVGCGRPANPFCSIAAPARDGCEATPPSTIPISGPLLAPALAASAPAKG